MTQQEQIAAFEADLDSLISRYCMEFDLCTASVVGVLAIAQHRLIETAMEGEGDDSDDDDAEEAGG